MAKTAFNKTSWTDRVKNEIVLQRVKDERSILYTTKRTLLGFVI
jgi:hypothetical protein